jgi:CheY-like chemotaxis protein
MRKGIKRNRSKQAVKRARVIESHEGQRQFIGTFLEPYFEIGGAGSAIEAMRLLGNGFIPDVIVFGTEITDMDSGVFLEALKSSGFFGEIPIVAIGNKEAKSKEQQLRSSGITAFYGIPFDPLDLQSHLIHIANRLP